MLRLLPLVESGNTANMWVDTSDGVANYQNLHWMNLYEGGRTYMPVHTRFYNSVFGMQLVLRSPDYNYSDDTE